MGLDLTYIQGQTPLDEEEKEGLLIPTITTQAELNEFEQQNIEDAMLWLIGRPLKAETIFTEKFIRELHKRMFGQVWAWAGDFRKTDKNLGTDKWQIPVSLRTLYEDALYWLQEGTYPPDELAVRFKHRIVSIHCFSNGNGRHSRLMADVIIGKVFGLPVFSWGAGDLANQSNTRTTYLNAVREADQGNIGPLLTFARA